MDGLRKDLNTLLSGTAFAIIQFDGSAVPIIFKSPTISTLLYADMYYDVKTNQFKNKGMFNKLELLNHAKDSGLLQKDYQNKLQILRVEISRLYDQLQMFKFQKARAQSIQASIEYYKKQMQKFQRKQFEIIIGSVQKFADIYRTYFIISQTAQDMDGSRYWQSHEDFLKQDYVFVSKIIGAYNQKFNFTEKKIRQVARSSMWRLRWNSTQDKCMGIFGIPAKDINNSQEILLYWSFMYDSAYNSLQPPSSSVIQDDDAFDEWLRNKGKDKNSGKRESIASKSNKPGYKQTFIVADKDGAEDVYALNEDVERVNMGKKMDQLDGVKTDLRYNYDLIREMVLTRKKG